MADCPTGVLIEVSPEPSPPPQTSKRTLNELLNQLGVKYSLSGDIRSGNTLPPINWKASTKQKKKASSPSISEDDFITNEVFDFKVPAFEELELPECDQKKDAPSEEQTTNESQLAFEFPVLSLDVPSASIDWKTEVTVEAKKISKRLSMITGLPLLGTDSRSESSVDAEDRTYTVLSSAKSSDTDDSVFCSPLPIRKLSSATKGKENNPKCAASSPPFVPHPNPMEALTPEGVRKIRGPLERRSTFTLDKHIATPKTADRLQTPVNHASRRFGQDITQTRLQTSTPISVQRSKSLMRTTEVSAKISTFRKGESPEIAQRRRSSSLGRCQNLSQTNLSFTKPSQPALLKSKVGGPSPLLRKALVPKIHSRPTSTLSNSSNTSRGPIKASVPAIGRESQRFLSSKQASTAFNYTKPRNTNPTAQKPI